MALTITQVNGNRVYGDRQIRYFNVTLDAAYPTGGYTFGAAESNLRSVDEVLPQNVGGYSLTYDYVAGKIKIFQGDNANVAAAPGVEVPANAAGLNGLVARVRVEGY